MDCYSVLKEKVTLRKRKPGFLTGITECALVPNKGLLLDQSTAPSCDTAVSFQFCLLRPHFSHLLLPTLFCEELEFFFSVETWSTSTDFSSIPNRNLFLYVQFVRGVMLFFV